MENSPTDFNTTISSRFHGAFNEIARLNFLWSECNTLASAGRLKQWRWKLDAIWRELYPSAVKLTENKKEHDWLKKVTNIDIEIEKSSKKLDVTELYLKLSEKEKLLRLIQDASGKGSSWVDDSESGFF